MNIINFVFCLHLQTVCLLHFVVKQLNMLYTSKPFLLSFCMFMFLINRFAMDSALNLVVKSCNIPHVWTHHDHGEYRHTKPLPSGVMAKNALSFAMPVHSSNACSVRDAQTIVLQCTRPFLRTTGCYVHLFVLTNRLCTRVPSIQWICRTTYNN